MQLCDAFGLPLVSLVDTPGFMVGPESERTATVVRHTSRMFLTAATLTVPFLCVIVRRAFGLGAQAMAGRLAARAGDHARVAERGSWARWASRARYGSRCAGELAAAQDEAAREQRVKELVAAVRAQSTALNAATYFELDDVIDPAETRTRLVQTLAAVAGAAAGPGQRTTAHDGRRVVSLLLDAGRAHTRRLRGTPPASAPRRL